MENYARATWKIVKVGRINEAILDVDSSKGWLGCALITSKCLDALQSLCYAEAESRAARVGLRLEQLQQESV